MKIFGKKEKRSKQFKTGCPKRDTGGGTTRANVYDYIDSLWVKLKDNIVYIYIYILNLWLN